jgi:hypothetical protein
MPFIEPESGDVGHGVGGGHASRNNVAFSFGGFGGWIDRDHAAFANGNTDWTVCRYDKLTEQITQAYDPPVSANVIFAGGGVVASWLGSKGEERGLYSTTGLRIRDAGLMGVGPDGAIAYKPDYQSNGPTYVHELDGAEWQLTPGHAGALQLLGDRRAIWTEGFSVHVAGLPMPQYINEDGIWAAHAAFVAGEWWISYFSGSRGVILHPFASSERCYSIVPKGDAWATMVAFGPDTIRMAIARTEGEGPGDIWGYDINVRTGAATPVPYWPTGRATTFPLMPTASVNVTIPTFSFNHKVMVAVFKDPNGDTNAPVEILVNQNDQQGTRPVFVVEDTLDSTFNGPLLGIYTESNDPINAIKAAAARQTRVMVCHDSAAAWTLPVGLRSWDIPMVELYRYQGEPLLSAVSRWRRDVDVMLATWAGDCGVVAQYYCMGGEPPNEVWPVAAILETHAYLNELVNRSARVKIVATFSYLRANGIERHPELRQSFENLLTAAGPNVAVLHPIIPVAAPAVTITSYGPAGDMRAVAVAQLSGDYPFASVEWRYRPVGIPEWKVAARTKPTDLAYIFTFIAIGDYEIAVSATTADGQTVSTGTRRLVHVTTPPLAPPKLPIPIEVPPMSAPKRVALRLGQFFASVDPAEMGKMLYGFGPLRFRESNKPTDANSIFLLSQPRGGDPRLLIRPESVPNGCLSIDATKYSPDLATQFGIKPNVTEEAWGGFEALYGWTLSYPSGPVSIVLAHYDLGGEHYESACLTVVALD